MVIIIIVYRINRAVFAMGYGRIRRDRCIDSPDDSGIAVGWAFGSGQFEVGDGATVGRRVVAVAVDFAVLGTVARRGRRG